MNHNDNDQNLINFIRQNKPAVPPSSPDLENRILQYVETRYIASPQNIASPQKDNIQKRRHIFFFSSAIAAGLIAAVVTYRNAMLLQPSAAELNNLEAFMENNWYGSLSSHIEDDLLRVTD
jgi:hypothetical protein